MKAFSPMLTFLGANRHILALCCDRLCLLSHFGNNLKTSGLLKTHTQAAADIMMEHLLESLSVYTNVI